MQALRHCRFNKRIGRSSSSTLQAVPCRFAAAARCSRTSARRAAPPRAAPLNLLLAAPAPFDRFDAEFDALRRQMDRDMDEAFRGMDRMLDASLREAQREQQQQLDQGGGGGLRARVERSEQRGFGSYRYYEHIEIRSGPYYAAPPPTYAALPQHASALPLAPLAAAALALAAVWAAVTAAFARNYALTTFADAAKARLLLAWPYLAAFSRKFRGQLVGALRGRPYRPTGDDDAGEGGSGSGSGSSSGSGGS